MDLLGFVLRIVCFSTAINLGKFLVMTLFMLVGPNIVTFVNYNSVAYMIRLSNLKTDKAYLKPNALKIISIAYTFTPSLFQGVGGGIQIVIKIRQTGVNIALTGLSIQLCLFLLFYVCLVYIGHNSSIRYTVEGVENPKKKALIRIWATVTLLLIRVIYRLVQFSTGSARYAATHEWELYVFDVTIVAITKESAEDDNMSKVTGE
ncbi:RTA-like protein [Thamnidium elegans]|nr:RTA-like protein [Thamnidium elegans]